MKILITGSNGLLGQKLVKALKNDPGVELIATARGANRLRDQEGYYFEDMDITDRQRVEEVFLKHQPEVLIHTAAMTHVDVCENNKEQCRRLNVNAVSFLIDAARHSNTHFVHLSTDFIFDGENGPYDEEAEAKPLNFYGQFKLDSEHLLQESGLPHAIIRTVLVYGIAEEMSRSNIVLWAKGALEKEQQIKVVNDQFRSPTLAEDLAEGCILAARQKALGIYNISGQDFMSVLELVWAVADFWQLDKSLITAVSSATLSQDAPRPPRTGFILDKARRELGYAPHSFQEGLALLDDQLQRRAENSAR